MVPWPVCPLAGHARLRQNVVAGSMMMLLYWLCWRACQEGVCLDPHFHCKRTLPRFSGELPGELAKLTWLIIFERFAWQLSIVQRPNAAVKPRTETRPDPLSIPDG